MDKYQLQMIEPIETRLNFKPNGDVASVTLAKGETILYLTWGQAEAVCRLILGRAKLTRKPK